MYIQIRFLFSSRLTQWSIIAGMLTLWTVEYRKYSMKGKGEEGGSSSLKLKLTDPCRTYKMLGRQVLYNAESPKQGSRKFNSIMKTKYIAVLGIVYLCFGPSTVPDEICCTVPDKVYCTFPYKACCALPN